PLARAPRPGPKAQGSEEQEPTEPVDPEEPSAPDPEAFTVHPGRARGSGDHAVARPPELTKSPVGHYEIIRPLGQGGMSQVYLARDTRLGRRVARKFLLKVDAHTYARFDAEAHA